MRPRAEEINRQPSVLARNPRGEQRHEIVDTQSASLHEASFFFEEGAMRQS
jgi:hypothetical protein